METNGTGRHEFVVANRGDRPLVLSRAKGSCGCCTCVCDVRLPEQGRVLPGASAKVTLEWSIKQYTGDFRQSENLTTNDPDRREVTLEVSGRITPTVRVVPTQLVFTRVAAGEPAVGEVYLYAYRSEALKILGHELFDPAKADAFKITWQPLAPEIESLRAKGWPLVLVDVGGLSQRPGAQGMIKLRVSVEAMAEMGYDAVGLGTADLRFPAPELLTVVAGEDGRPCRFLSANVGLFGPPGQVTPKQRTIQAGGVKVGVISGLGSKYQREIHNPDVGDHGRPSRLGPTG